MPKRHERKDKGGRKDDVFAASERYVDVSAEDRTSATAHPPVPFDSANLTVHKL
jgi:hypothetical protein